VASKILTAVTTFIIGTISAGGYLGIAVLMAIESACIPLPSEVIMPFSGFLVAQGRFNLWLTGVAGAVGCVIGSAAAYWVGYYGGRPLVRRYRRCLLISARDLARADGWFERYGDATIFFSRLLPLIRTFISLPAGVARMRFGRFCLYTFLGSLPWCLALSYLGYRTGRHWADLRRYFHDLDAVILAALAAVAVWWVWRHVKHEREEAREASRASEADPASRAEGGRAPQDVQK
jgi:membrane protein DedA with SNARE-associated domain